MTTLFDTHEGPEIDILHYLESIPAYPFDKNLDTIFVDELIGDFPHINILDQIKAFRWYHNGHPAKHNDNLRLAIRRWLANARY